MTDFFEQTATLPRTRTHVLIVYQTSITYVDRYLAFRVDFVSHIQDDSLWGGNHYLSNVVEIVPGEKWLHPSALTCPPARY
jgi:hypothetical protein